MDEEKKKELRDNRNDMFYAVHESDLKSKEVFKQIKKGNDTIDMHDLVDFVWDNIGIYIIIFIRKLCGYNYNKWKNILHKNFNKRFVE